MPEAALHEAGREPLGRMRAQRAGKPNRRLARARPADHTSAPAAFCHRHNLTGLRRALSCCLLEGKICVSDMRIAVPSRTPPNGGGLLP